MTIRKKLTLSGGLIAVGAFLLLSASTYLTFKVERDFEKLNEQTLVIIEQIEDIRFFGVQIISAANEKLLLDHLESMKPGMALHHDHTTHKMKLRKLTPSHKVKTSKIMQLVDSYNKTFGRYSLYVNKYFPGEIKFKQAIEASGRELIHDIRSSLSHRTTTMKISDMLAFKKHLEKKEEIFLKQIQAALIHEHEELNERTVQLVNNITAMQNWIWYCFIALMAVIILANILLSKNLINRIDNLRDITLRVRQGDLSARAVNSGHDELSDLATAFNNMTADLSLIIKERDEANQLMNENQAKLNTVQHSNLMAVTTASIAHELNQPLAAINNYVEGSLMRLQSGNYQIPEIEKTLKMASEQTMRTSRILSRIRQLLQKDKHQKLLIDINVLIEETMILLKEKTVENNITINLNLDPSLPLVEADQSQIQQVIVNLTENAMEAIKTNAANKREMIIKTFSPDRQSIEVHIQNMGATINPEDLTHVFEPFFTSKTGSLGMGLTICHSIIETHHGRIWATSNHDEGTVFIFSLPLNVKTKSKESLRAV